jgi:hypothetical protein
MCTTYGGAEWNRQVYPGDSISMSHNSCIVVGANHISRLAQASTEEIRNFIFPAVVAHAALRSDAHFLRK